jgi:glycosyltransferase involved in cell wall biosynthesis
MPILFVHHRPELGGAPRSLAYLIAELDRDRFEPHVYCPPGAAARLFREAGATVHTGTVAGFTHIWASTYHGRRWLLLLRELARLPSHLRRLRATLRAHDFGLVHLNDSPLIPAAWAARRAGLPVVWHLRSALPGDGDDRRSRLVRAAIRRFATASIAINGDVADSFAVDSTVIPNAVDLAHFRPGDRAAAKAALGIPSDRPVVSFFGFAYPSKGFHTLIRAAAELERDDVEADYLIVGGAVRGAAYFRTLAGRALLLAGLTRDYESEARRLVAGLGLDERVRFVPFAPDTAGLYGATDVVAAPSQGPELGRPVLEAAACGVPVVASGSRTGGGVLVPDETGLLLEDRSVEALATALGALLRDPERRGRLGAAARRHAEQAFDPTRAARAVEALYATVVA